ncbi:hypothetical protein NCS56_00450000 [Fusarium sp. Ph1]|nr:hypothetical protein NCS56_00450000 [Fusarium sp. Ph1]
MWRGTQSPLLLVFHTLTPLTAAQEACSQLIGLRTRSVGKTTYHKIDTQQSQRHIPLPTRTRDTK